MATLSIFDPLITENDVIKATQHIYNQSSSWQLTEDIDFTCGKAHLANLGYEPLDTEDFRFKCINFQPFMYQIHTDYSRTRLDKHKKAAEIDRIARKKIYEEKNDQIKLALLKKEEEDAHIASVMCEYPLCSMLSKVNHQGDIINTTINGYDANSVEFHEMLLANSESMKNDFTLKNTNTLKLKKRMEFTDSLSQEQAREDVDKIYNQRLRMNGEAMANKNLQHNGKRHHSGISKSMTNRASMIQQMHDNTMRTRKQVNRLMAAAK